MFSAAFICSRSPGACTVPLPFEALLLTLAPALALRSLRFVPSPGPASTSTLLSVAFPSPGSVSGLRLISESLPGGALTSCGLPDDDDACVAEGRDGASVGVASVSSCSEESSADVDEVSCGVADDFIAQQPRSWLSCAGVKKSDHTKESTAHRLRSGNASEYPTLNA